jgi:hypothetical protein
MRYSQGPYNYSIYQGALAFRDFIASSTTVSTASVNIVVLWTDEVVAPSTWVDQQVSAATWVTQTTPTSTWKTIRQ